MSSEQHERKAVIGEFNLRDLGTPYHAPAYGECRVRLNSYDDTVTVEQADRLVLVSEQVLAHPTSTHLILTEGGFAIPATNGTFHYRFMGRPDGGWATECRVAERVDL